ncbi:MAG: efflux RND transporter periplasmic adaptor subunit [Candidatus Binatia bacterium]
MRLRTAFVLALAAGAAAAAWGAWTWQNGEPEAAAYRAVHAERRELRVTVLASAVVQPQNRVEVRPPIAGRVEDVIAREGQRVRKGQVLARMSSSERAALLDAARVKGAQELAHWEELYKATPLLAPLSGTVIARNAEPGQTVTATDAVLVLSDRLIVKAQVDETDIGRVALRQEAVVSLDAYPAEKIPAGVDHIAYEAVTVSNVTVYEVDVLPERVPEFMRSGMTANVTFVVAERADALVLPAEAVQREGESAFVLAPAPGHREPERRQVEVGLTDGKSVEILAGLGERDTALVPVFRLPDEAGGGSSPFFPFGGGRSRGK